MTVLASFKLSIFINCILSLNQFHFISGTKPRCIGGPLEPEEFSREGEVGFVRDICVDIIARNLYNESGYPVSKLCEELANVRTSTCACICSKWKRSSSWNKAATHQVMIMAEALMEDLIKGCSEVKSPKNIDNILIFERIIHAKRRLINSGAAAKDSKIVGQLEKLKEYFAPPNKLLQHQIEYQESIGQSDAETLQKYGKLLENEDMANAINRFINNCEQKQGMRILNHHIEKDVTKALTTKAVVRLKFEYEKDGETKDGSAILKVPSILPSYYQRWKGHSMFDTEIYFYESLLPALYQLGKCEPFAPKLYLVTRAKALVLEDLSSDGYRRFYLSGSEFLDLDHSRMSLDVLAKYHALSYSYLQNNGRLSSIKPLQRSVIKQNEFDIICEAIKPSLSSTLYEKILKMAPEIIATHPTINYHNRNSMVVIIHGDFHERNILFKYDANGKVFQAKIIDWQFGEEASPVVDLINFFVSNINIAVVEANGDDLINFYLDRLNHNLSLLSTTRIYNKLELDGDIAYFKYYHFDALRTLIWQGKKEMWESNMSRWILYLERKGLI